MSPVLAASDMVERLSADGIDREALDVALTVAADSDTPTALAQAVSDVLGEETLSATAFLRALYGNLYQILLVQQGPKAVAFAAASSAGNMAWTAPGFRTTDLPAPDAAVDGLRATQSKAAWLPRFRFPSIQARAPGR